ncbi:hypothetical protein AFI02nite_00180 [Aliivibrio fischeri]|uniref:Uncharacterized protein n=1 Tax=Aliivibrio fischeri TaxID=668 RepID=A0A510UBM9_ALIFS|nr:hypothetical protein AFI02nite_00180 [Aliivibrio fischeri]
MPYSIYKLNNKSHHKLLRTNGNTDEKTLKLPIFNNENITDEENTITDYPNS